MLKLTVLIDDSIKLNSHLATEHGISLYLQCNDLKLLFDTGDTNLYLKNAQKLGINLSDVDFIVFSHNHYDHSGGLRFFPRSNSQRIKIVAHKYAFYPRQEYKNYLANPELNENFDIIATDSSPFEISDNLIFLSEIPRKNDFEGQKIFGKVQLPSGEIEDDFCREDSALIYKSYDEIVVITGCSHSGICNIIQYAKTVAEQKWGISKLKTIIGGFHLIKTNSEILSKTIESFKELGVTEVHPCHCTDLAAKLALAFGGFSVNEVSAGTIFDYAS